jgi:hypothetical protein
MVLFAGSYVDYADAHLRPLYWGGWLLLVGCVQLLAVAHQGGVWVQAPRFLWSRRWAPPGMGWVRRPSSVKLCLRPPAVGLCPAVCVLPAGGGCVPPVTFQKKHVAESAQEISQALRGTVKID